MSGKTKHGLIIDKNSEMSASEQDYKIDYISNPISPAMPMPERSDAQRVAAYAAHKYPEASLYHAVLMQFSTTSVRAIILTSQKWQ